MVSSKEVITNVVSRLEEARREDLHSLHSEYQDSHRSINDLIEVSRFDNLILVRIVVVSLGYYCGSSD